MLVRRQVTEIMCEQEVIIEFASRAHCDPYETGEFRSCLSAASFSEVRAY